MTFEKDYLIKVKNDYDFWDTWLRFVGIHEVNELPPLLRHIYVTAMLMPQDEPFMGNSMKILIKALNETNFNGKVYEVDNATFASYKRMIKVKGWLNGDGSLPTHIRKFRELYKRDIEQGIQSVSLIYKICVC